MQFSKSARILTTAFALVAMIGLAGCEEEGAGEKAGKKLDEAGKEIGKSMDEMKKNLSK